MEKKRYLDLLRKGKQIRHTWRTFPFLQYNLSGADLSSTILINGDLSGVNLSGADLSSALLYGTNLSEANLNGADLGGAILMGANLSGATLIGASLISANFSETNLSEADLSYANLLLVNLNFAKLKGANLSEATIGMTSFGNIDFRSVKGLETTKHICPSIIGMDTFLLSHGNIPEIFLRGIGLPDSTISYSHSLLGQPLDYYTCFISYSSKDQPFAERLHADLQARGVRCWFAPHDLRIGDRFADRIEESIRTYDKLLVVLSENSVRSTWVEDECRAALEKEKRFKEEQQLDKTVLFPIKLDEAIEDATSQWICKIRRERHIGNFTRWKDYGDYQQAFDRLLRDLKAGA